MKKYIITVLVVSSFFACDDNNEGNLEPWEPGPLEEFTVTPINGGATITYTIPKDPDILYVMAEYQRNGKTYTEKSSVHNNCLTIEGFHGENYVKATLCKVNRHEQRSEPVVVEFEPLESVISIAQKSLIMKPDFGGIYVSWDNPLTTELGIRLMVEDSLNVDKLITHSMYYSMLQNGVHAFRGFEYKETLFAIAIEDKWGNVSDTILLVTTPYFETMIEKPFVDLRKTIPYDNITQQSGQPIDYLWNNIVNKGFDGYRTVPGSSGVSFTFDLKQVVKISRIVHHPYHINTPYNHSNVNEVELWATNKLDYDKLSDLPYWLDEYSLRLGSIHDVDPDTELPERTFKDDWEYLGWQTIPRYDLLGDSEASSNYAANGYEYEIPSTAEPVRYIRIYVRSANKMYPIGEDNQYSIGEITVYGDNSVPQE